MISDQGVFKIAGVGVVFVGEFPYGIHIIIASACYPPCITLHYIRSKLVLYQSPPKRKKYHTPFFIETLEDLFLPPKLHTRITR